MQVDETNKKTIRQSLFQVLEPQESSSPGSKFLNVLLLILIGVNVVAVTLETVQDIYIQYEDVFTYLEIFSVIVFSLEYVLRIWTSVELKADQSALKTRLEFIKSPLAIIDLVAILPFYLSLFFAIDLRFLRVLRLLRVLKLTRYSVAMKVLFDVFKEESSTIFAAIFILLVILVLAACGIYLVEHKAQPEVFGSIPQAMWWSTVTLTTVGYGDVTPITTMGKIFGGLVTILGVGMAALPAGILASGLADQLRRRRDSLRRQFQTMLEDGIICELEEEEFEKLRVSLGLSRNVAKQIREEVRFIEEVIEKRSCPHCGKSVYDEQRKRLANTPRRERYR